MSLPGTLFRRNDSFSGITVRYPLADVNGQLNHRINQNNNNNNNINNNKNNLKGLPPRQRKVSRYMSSKTSLTESNTDNNGQSSVTSYLSHRYHHPHVEHDRREKITINVSGERYQTYVDTLDRFPQTLLGNSLKREEFYDDVEDEYFFDRDRTAFNAILYYYQSWGQLYCPLTVPMTILVTEAKFFELGNDALKQVLDLQSEDSRLQMPKNKLKKKMWCLFEHPETSTPAHILTVFSVLMILFSVTILCVETLPIFRTTEQTQTMTSSSSSSSKVPTTFPFNIVLQQIVNDRSTLHTNTTGRTLEITTAISSSCQCLCKCNITNRWSLSQHQHRPPLKPPLPSLRDDIARIPSWKNIFQICEMVSVIWFTFEFLIRFFSCPNKKKFMSGFLNIIDIVSILPFYITLMLNRHEGIGLENLRVVRLVRVFRIFKLSRHSKGLQILGLTLRASMRELGLMVFFLAIGVILFSSAVYYLETDNFSSIPDAFWWAIITMCTVGYGDKVPRTFWGKLVGSACSVCGVLSIALPVPVIVSNFDYFYNRERTKKMHQGFLEHSKPEGFKKPSITGSSTHHQTPKLLLNSPNNINNNNDNKNRSSIHQPVHQSNSLSPGAIQMNGSLNKSASDSRNDEIHRQATLRGLERRSRKLSQKLSEASLHSPYRKNGHAMSLPTKIERESFM